ncbi:MAG: hypothetical protein H6978_04085 [Gammaproteobacteria bacterium]|nr:hypothetical protein [Gammaproteobacteria bacterium]
MNNEPSYALVHFSLKHRVLLLILAALMPVLLIALIAWPDLTATMVIAGVIAGGAAVFCMQLFIEIVAVIAETLLPR